MNTKGCGLSPTEIMIGGLHAPGPPWDFGGISPLNNHKAHGIKTSMSFNLLIQSRQLDYSSGDLIPRRALPSNSASASDQIQFIALSFI